MREVGRIGREEDSFAIHFEKRENVGGGVFCSGVDDDFVMIGQRENTLVEGPVGEAGEGEAVARVARAAIAFGDDVGRVGLDGVRVDEFLASDCAGAVVVTQDHVAEKDQDRGLTPLRELRACHELYWPPILLDAM